MKISIAFLIAFGVSTTVSAENIIVTFKSEEEAGGNLFVALFDKAEQFPDGEPLEGLQKQWSGTTTEVRFDGVGSGEYAIAAFLDKDNNAALSKNFFGIPTEPFGFSGATGFGKPAFSEVSFEKELGEHSIQIVLEN